MSQKIGVLSKRGEPYVAFGVGDLAILTGKTSVVLQLQPPYGTCHPVVTSKGVIRVKFGGVQYDLPKDTAANLFKAQLAAERGIYILPSGVQVNGKWQVKMPHTPWIAFDALDRPQVVEHEGNYFVFFSNAEGLTEVHLF